jgi:NAD-dependent dihydropyrimidine dehydrogenase PreA subunit
MIRKIVNIDSEKCNGCGLCITACHEGALQLVDGKASLISDVYCDGLGDCLPQCPTDAIKIIEREAEEFDEILVKERMEKLKAEKEDKLSCDCPSTQTKVFIRKENNKANKEETNIVLKSQLRQWPCQIQLAPVNAPYFKNADILIAADCTAYAYADIHNKFMKNKITLIGCPKLDNANYSEKIAAILNNNNINSITILRMEVPCCGGIVNSVKTAMQNSGKIVPWQIVTISTDGEII